MDQDSVAVPAGKGRHRRRLVALAAGLVLAMPIQAAAASAPNWTYAWGVNGLGQLGRGTFTLWDAQPAPVPALSGIVDERVVALSVGADHMLAVRKDGSVWAWGGNNSGQLGDGTQTPRATPVRVMESATKPLTNVMTVAAGWQFSLALKNDGTVWAWGRNGNGELSDGTRTDRGFAAAVIESQCSSPLCGSGGVLGGITAIAAGWGYGVASMNDGTVWHFGRRPWQQVGAVSADDVLDAKKILELNFCAGICSKDTSTSPHDLCAIAAGMWHVVGLECAGSVVTWGLNDVGQLGQSTGHTCAGAVASPCREAAGPSFLSNIVAVAAGDDYSLALDSSGMVFAWGTNVFGELGDGTTSPHTAPAPVTDSSGSALSGITTIAGGEAHALARKSDGTVLAWGLATQGRLGTSLGPQICPAASTPCATRAIVSGSPAGLGVLDAIAAGGGSSAIAGGPLVTVLPGSKSLDFPFQPALDESAKQKLMVFNRDSSPMTVTAVDTHNTHFLETDTCVGTPVPPDASCAIDVSFKPFVGGAQSALMDVKHPATGAGVTTVSLSGSGLWAVPGYQPSALAFGDTAFSRTRVLTVSLVNSGAGGLALGQMSTDLAEFAVVSTNCGSTLAGGASCAIAVQYQPFNLGPETSKLHVETLNVLAPTIDLPLSGNGVLPSASVSPTSINFGPTNVGAQVSNPVTLTNTGTVALGVASVTIVGSQQFKTTGCPASIPAGASCTVWATYAPSLTGAAHANLRLDDDAGPHYVVLDGVGLPVGVPTVVPNIVTFLAQGVRTRSAVRQIALGNTGGAPFTVLQVGIGRPHVRDFDIISDTCTGKSILSPTTCSVSVVFFPLATDARQAELDIVTTSGPVHVDLRGTGVAGGLASLAWPQIGFSPAHGAFTPEETGIGTASVGTLVLTWQEQTKGAVASSPAVMADLAFWGSDDGQVYAYELPKRALLWTYATGGPVRSSPAVANGVVYVGSTDGSVYALDSASGQLVWQVKTGGAVLSSPSVADGVVYVGSMNGHVYALEAAGGAILWDRTLNAPVETSPAVSGSVVYATDANRLRALDARTGALLWTAFAGALIRSSPTAYGPLVLVEADNGTLYAFDALTGGTRWRFTAGGPVTTTAAVADDIVYVGADDGNVYALDAFTRAVLWVAPIGKPIRSSPAVVNGILYVGADDGAVHALEAWTGASLWQEQTQGPIRSSPAVAGGVVYVGSDDGWMYAFQP